MNKIKDSSKNENFKSAAQEVEAAETEAAVAEAAVQALGEQGAPPETDLSAGLVPGDMTVAALQEELSRRGLDTKWNPLKKKKELVDRLQALRLLSEAATCALLRE